MLIKTLLREATERLKTSSSTPPLDAELLLMHCCNLSRTQLYTVDNINLSEDEIQFFFECIRRRQQGEPIAYILGTQEFWSLEFEVTKDTLIPRPETEHLIEWTLQNLPAQEKLRIADLGTGSGAIAIAIAHERPHWTVHATDKSSAALLVAERNAKHHQIKNIEFYNGPWCTALPTQCYHAIITNPPYIADNDPHLAALSFEPRSALVSGIDGLSDILTIASRAQAFLESNGALVIEHGYDQAEKVLAIFEELHYKNIQQYRDLADHVRYTVGYKPTRKST